MPATITVTLDESRFAAVVAVDGISASAATVSITRTPPSGNTAAVRGYVAYPVQQQATVIARDYEAPLNLELEYRARIVDAAGVELETVTATFQVDWPHCEAWLVDLARPTNSLPLTVESMRELAYAAPAGVHRVLGRRTPVLTTLPAWTPTTELVVLTDTLDERDQVRAALGNGYPVLLRTDPGQGIGNLYLGVTAYVEERFLTRGEQPERRFRVQSVQVERPDPTVFVPVAPNTYRRVAQTFATYADLRASGLTYDELAYTYPAEIEASPIVPWPPDDV